jgi:hypothetical protein
MKKGYFFTLDAFIAMTIMVVCLILIFSIQTYKPYPMQSVSFSEDLMKTLSQTRLYELQNDYYYWLLEGGNITQTDNTILEQIAWFAISGQPELANSFALNLTPNLVPKQFGSQLIIYNESMRFETNLSETDTTQQKARLLISSKRMIMGENEGVPWGPMLAEVRLWQ